MEEDICEELRSHSLFWFTCLYLFYFRYFNCYQNNFIQQGVILYVNISCYGCKKSAQLKNAATKRQMNHVS